VLAIWCHENGVLGSYLKLSGVYGVLGVFRSTAGTGIRVFRLFFFRQQPIQAAEEFIAIALK
jgi:hypothetical protein